MRQFFPHQSDSRFGLGLILQLEPLFGFYGPFIVLFAVGLKSCRCLSINPSLHQKRNGGDGYLAGTERGQRKDGKQATEIRQWIGQKVGRDFIKEEKNTIVRASWVHKG
jgi:hypothetical protein